MLAEAAPVTLMTFDLLRLYGVELLSAPRGPTAARRSNGSSSPAPRWQTPPTFADGVTLHAATKEQGLEGIVSKRVDSAYVPGLRSPLWLKSPHRGTVSVVIGGWRAGVRPARCRAAWERCSSGCPAPAGCATWVASARASPARPGRP